MGLRAHAAIVALCMVFLISLLGARAYLIARVHFREIRDLAERDLAAQSLLVKMEALTQAKAQAQRKYLYTQDRAYAQLAVREGTALTRQRETLRELIGQQHPEVMKMKLQTSSEIRNLQQTLDQERQSKLARADTAALGLLRLILFAFILSIGIAVWLLALFYRGLLNPLQQLKEATARITTGDLASRITHRQGVAELASLSESFNQMAERLEELERSKGEFLAMVSHEFKNPLTALKEGLTLLSSRSESLAPQSREKAFAACLIASKRLESMMNNLLRHARLESGFFDFDLALKDLSGAIRTAVEEVEPLAAKKGMSIRYVGPKELFASFNWDGIIHALENLLLNAIKYGTEKTNIDVAVAESAVNSNPDVPGAHGIEISILNSGRQMATMELSRIFDRFYRGTNSQNQQGLGLGLHVVKRIVEAHHGKIAVSSENGKTEFKILIPGQYENLAWAPEGNA